MNAKNQRLLSLNVCLLLVSHNCLFRGCCVLKASSLGSTKASRGLRHPEVVPQKLKESIVSILEPPQNRLLASVWKFGVQFGSPGTYMKMPATAQNGFSKA